MRTLRGVAIVSLALGLLAGCEDCGGEPTPDPELTIAYPTGERPISFADDTDLDVDGLNYDVVVFAENVPEGDVIRLVRGDEEETAEIEFTSNPLTFTDFNLGTEAGEVTLYAEHVASGTRSAELTLELEGEPVECPTVSMVNPQDGATLTDNDDEDPGAIGLQYTVRASTNAPSGSVAELLENDRPIAEANVRGTVIEFTGVTLTEPADGATQVYEVRISDAPDGCAGDVVSVTIDLAAPACEITSPSDDVLNSEDDQNARTPGLQTEFIVETDAGDTVTIQLFVEGEEAGTAETTSGDASFGNVGLDEGTAAVYAVCADEAGNTARSATAVYTIDTVAPDVSLGRRCGETVNATIDDLETLDGAQLVVNVSTSAADAESAVIETDVTAPLAAPYGEVESGFTGAVDMYIDAEGVGSGAHTITATVTDEHGNAGVGTCEILFDNDNPAVAFRTPEAGVLNMEDDLDADALDLQIVVCVCTDQEEATGTASLWIDADGARAEVSGAIGEWSAGCEADGTTYDWEVCFNGDTPVTLGQGEYDLEVEVTDEAGNVGRSSIGVTVDTVAPQCGVYEPTCGEPLDPSLLPIEPLIQMEEDCTLTITNASGEEIYRETRSPGVGGGAVRYPPAALEDGDNTLVTTSVDDAGNVYTSPDCVVTVDLIYDLAINTPREGEALGLADAPGGTFDVCFSSTALPVPTTVNVLVDGAAGSPPTVEYTGSPTCFSLTLAEGDHTIELTTDLGGELTSSGVRNVSVDLTAPGLSTDLGLAVTNRRAASLRASWSAPEDPDSLSFIIRWSHDPITDEADFDAAHDVPYTGAPVAGGAAATEDINFVVIERDYYFAVRAVDPAGNEGAIAARPVPAHPGFNIYRTETAPTTSTLLGLTVSPAGDLDGDGETDLVIGSNVGTWIYWGPMPDPGVEPLWSRDVLQQNPGEPGSRASAVGVGDFNGDGVDDLAVGAGRSAEFRGQVFIYYGGARGTWPRATADITLNGTTANGLMGWTIAGIGDFCGGGGAGDGFMDIAFSEPSAAETTGRVYVVCGGDYASGISADIGDGTIPTLEIDGTDPVAGAVFGVPLAGLGDVDGDDLDDFAISSADATTRGYGEVYVVHGMNIGTITSTPVITTDAVGIQTIQGPDGEGSFGSRLAGMGDLDGDGFADLATSAPRATGPLGADQGIVYVFFSNGSSLDTSYATILNDFDDAAGDQFGSSLAMYGAGFGGAPDRSIGHAGVSRALGDLIMSGQRMGTGVGGPLAFLFGNPAALSPDDDVLMTNVADDPATPESDDGVGLFMPGETNVSHHEVMAYIGDINGDGYQDFAIGNQRYPWDEARGNWSWRGQVVIYY